MAPEPTAPKYRLTLNYSREFVHAAVVSFWWRVVGLRTVVALGLLAVAVGSLLAQGDRSWKLGLFASMFALGIAFTVLVYVGQRRGSLHRLAAMGAPTATLELSEASFTTISGGGSASVPWRSIVEVWRFERCWLLMFGPSQFMTLPLADVPAEAAEFILERVRAAGGAVK